MSGAVVVGVADPVGGGGAASPPHIGAPAPPARAGGSAPDGGGVGARADQRRERPAACGSGRIARPRPHLERIAAAARRRGGLGDERRRLRSLVLDPRPRRAGSPASARPAASRLPVPADGEPRLAGRGGTHFLDYFYVSFTNSIAFSPTDAFALTRPAKLLMLSGSAISALTVLLVAARAVSILGSAVGQARGATRRPGFPRPRRPLSSQRMLSPRRRRRWGRSARRRPGTPTRLQAGETGARSAPC